MACEGPENGGQIVETVLFMLAFAAEMLLNAQLF